MPNPRRDGAAAVVPGREQKAWFLDAAERSTREWKIWGHSVGTLDWRTDLQNLRRGCGPRWPGAGYGLIGSGDWASYRTERAEILDFVRESITGFADGRGRPPRVLGGPRLARPAAAALRAAGRGVHHRLDLGPGALRGDEYSLPKDDPLRALYLHEPPAAGTVEPAINLPLLHGVRASLALARTGDASRRWHASNPEVAPHLSFADLGGHGYAVVRAGADELETEFVCIPRPLERSDRPDGGPLAYRVTHRARRWAGGAAPRLERTRAEGALPLSV